jgi:hypothetical protein
MNTESPYLQELLAERAEDINHRRASGIELTWSRARAQYAHGDAEKVSASLPEKGRTLDGPIITGYREPDNDGRSTVSVNITRPYTNAGTARTSDLLLPAGDRDNWDLRETPISDVETLRPYFEAQPQLLEALPAALRTKLSQLPDARKAAIAVCRALIKDYLLETDFASKTRKQIKEAGLVGTGVLYGPFPEERKLTPDVRSAVEVLVAAADPLQQSALRFELEMRVLRRPALEQIPIENCYWDKACGTNIQKGRRFWQVVPDISKRQLRNLRTAPGYFAEEIDYLLTQEPKSVSELGGATRKSFEIWRRTGEVNIAKLSAELGADEEDFEGAQWEFLERIATSLGKDPESLAEDEYHFLQLEFINDKLVKVNALPTDSYEFPYRFLVWEARNDSPAGISIPEQIETPQRGLNAAVRAAQDNLGWSVGPGLLFRQGRIQPLAGEGWQHYPYKVYEVTEDALAAMQGKESRPEDALKFLEFPNYLAQILPWINYWLQMAEQTTGLPLMLQGQKVTDSVGVTNALLGSSTTNLRLFIKHWDDDNCAPIVTDYYNWVQLYGPERAQSDAVAHALGSSILVEKELQQQAMLQLVDRAVQPVYGLSPKRLMRRLVEGFGINHEDVQITPEEEEQLRAAEQQPEAAVQVAQIRAQTDTQIAQMQAQLGEMKLMLEQQIKGAEFEHAKEVVQTQGLMAVAQESVKQDGSATQQAQAHEHAKELQTRDAALDPMNPLVQPEAEMVSDDDLAELGLQ